VKLPKNMNQKSQNCSIKQNVDARLLRIANFLLLNSSFIDNLGLLNGKIGIAVFFYQYSRYSKIKIFEDYAGNLMDEIYEEININTPLDFDNGLAGIGWSIEYLVCEKFLNANRDEVLEEIDKMVHKNLLLGLGLLENENNIFGFGIYYLARLSHREKHDEIPTIISDKNTLDLVISNYMRLLVNNRYLCPYNHSISVRVLVSILYFLDWALKYKNCQTKIEKMLMYLTEYIEFSLVEEFGFIDRFVLAKLLEKIVVQIALPKLKKTYKDIIEKVKVFDENNNDESTIDQVSRISWYYLVLGIDYIDFEHFKIFIQKAFYILDNENNWNKRISMSNKNNMGLDSGLAGLGFILTLYAPYYGKDVTV
jgi:hypothetical protein